LRFEYLDYSSNKNLFRELSLTEKDFIQYIGSTNNIQFLYINKKSIVFFKLEKICFLNLKKFTKSQHPLANLTSLLLKIKKIAFSSRYSPFFQETPHFYRASIQRPAP